MAKNVKLHKSSGEKASIILKYALGVILLIYALSLLVPIYWMIINSFKDIVQYYQESEFSFPKSLYLDNYKFILNNMSFETTSKDGSGTVIYTLPWMFYYSFIWAFGNTAFCLIIQVMCAYVVAKYKFPGRNFLYSLGIILMILPIIGSTGSAMLLRRQLGVYNNMLLMILTAPCLAFSGINFMMLHAAFKGVPWEYAEAVFIDGGGHLRVFITIMFPMIMPTFWVLMLLGFIGAWNDYSSFMFWMPSYYNVAMGVYRFQYESRLELGTTMPQILASFAVVSLPVVILYVAFQKLITANFMVGGLKG